MSADIPGYEDLETQIQGFAYEDGEDAASDAVLDLQGSEIAETAPVPPSPEEWEPEEDPPALEAAAPRPGIADTGDTTQAAGDDLQAWFAQDWVDATLLTPEPSAALDDLPGDAEVDSVARVLWNRAHPDGSPPADDAVSVLLAVVEEGADELDRRAAQVILGMLGHLPT